MTSAHRSLLVDMREALKAEIGASTVYRLLSARTRDEDLRGILLRFDEDEAAHVDRLRGVMIALGARPRRRSLRRRVAARALAESTRIAGLRFALRVCQEAEATVARWYLEYAHYLARVGELDHARTCHQLSDGKQRHARILQTWVDNLPAR